MTQYQKEYNYVRGLFVQCKSSAGLREAKSLKQQFINKYVVLISPTDKTFLRMVDSLTKIELDVTRRMSSNYLF